MNENTSEELTETSTSSKETSESQNSEQEGKTSTTEPRTYEYRGEKLTGDQVYEKYLALEKDYSKKS